MIETKDKNSWSLFRMIIPAFPGENIFTRQAKKTTALGAIMVATAANKLWGWRVEVVDENNCRKGPKDKDGLLDHVALQKERPAVAVGFYCGLTSTIERVWQLAKFYQGEGVFTIAGGWHAHHCPEETLQHNVDVVVHGDGEETIQQLLNTLKQEEVFLNEISGISFLQNGEVRTNASELVEVLGLDPNLSKLPFPDFGLLRYAEIKLFPIGRIKGCSRNCEFCGVKEKPHWACAEHLFETVSYLVETKKARKFFLVDDSLKEDIEGTKKFFKMIADKYGVRLNFSIQLWLKIAENREFLGVMKKAGVRTACIGCESPITEDLEVMRKGYRSDKMIGWLKVLRGYFKTHIMLIAGYPLAERNVFLSAKEIIKCYRRFIRKVHPDSIHVMLPGPGVGTDLRERLKKEGRLFPLSVVPWRYYDGRFVCFKPDSSMGLQELQELPLKIMSRFYNPWSFLRIPLRTIAFPGHYFLMGWSHWVRGWVREIVRFGGYLLMRKWKAKQQVKEFIKKLEDY